VQLKQFDDDNKPDGNFIVVNGPNTNHQYTDNFVEGIEQDFTYIHIDAHCDCDSGAEWDCATFVPFLIHPPNVKGALFYGVDAPTWGSDDFQKKIIHPKSDSIEEMMSEIPTKYVYISTDLDVIKELECVSNHAGYCEMGSHFFFSPTKTQVEVLDFIRGVGEQKKILGGDICGYIPAFHQEIYPHYLAVYHQLSISMMKRKT